VTVDRLWDHRCFLGFRKAPQALQDPRDKLVNGAAPQNVKDWHVDFEFCYPLAMTAHFGEISTRLKNQYLQETALSESSPYEASDDAGSRLATA
jgi:hypothetical protein